MFWCSYIFFSNSIPLSFCLGRFLLSYRFTALFYFLITDNKCFLTFVVFDYNLSFKASCSSLFYLKILLLYFPISVFLSLSLSLPLPPPSPTSRVYSLSGGLSCCPSCWDLLSMPGNPYPSRHVETEAPRCWLDVSVLREAPSTALSPPSYLPWDHPLLQRRVLFSDVCVLRWASMCAQLSGTH